MYNFVWPTDGYTTLECETGCFEDESLSGTCFIHQISLNGVHLFTCGLARDFIHKIILNACNNLSCLPLVF